LTTTADAGLTANITTITATDVSAPPAWAVMQRHLMRTMEEAALLATEKYARPGGLVYHVHDVDDAYESRSMRAYLQKMCDPMDWQRLCKAATMVLKNHQVFEECPWPPKTVSAMFTHALEERALCQRPTALVLPSV